MKSQDINKLVKSLFVGFCFWGLDVVPISAQQVVNSFHVEAVQMLNSFYSRYITNLLENKDEANLALKQRYFLPGVMEQVEEMIAQSDADGVLRAQDVSEQMQKSLQIFPLGNQWFMVTYSWDEQSGKKVEIPVKVSNETGKYLIKYIVPDTKGEEYGDQLLSDKKESGIAVPVNVQKLKKAFSELVCNQKSAEKERAFFDAFPKTWNEFILTYGFLPPYDGNLYAYYGEHLSAFEHLSSIPQKEYCSRLINLCCGGHWEADATGFLQHILITYTMKNLNVVLKQLELFESDAFYVWQFFFQSLHKEKALQQNYETIRAEVIKNSKLSVKDLDLAFKVSYGRASLEFGGRFPTFDENHK